MILSFQEIVSENLTRQRLALCLFLDFERNGLGAMPPAKFGAHKGKDLRALRYGMSSQSHRIVKRHSHDDALVIFAVVHGDFGTEFRELRLELSHHQGLHQM